MAERTERELVEAARAVVEAGDVTKDGRPRVRAMEKMAGRDITEEQRDEAWRRLLDEEAKPGGDGPPAGLVEVTLAKEHTHRGIVRPAGSRVKGRPGQAEWLREMGVID